MHLSNRFAEKKHCIDISDIWSTYGVMVLCRHIGDYQRFGKMYLLLHHEDGGSVFFQNVGYHLHGVTI